MVAAALSSGWRPPAPDLPALVRWPDAFGTRFTLFVDTEEEFDWRRPLSATNRSVSAIAALPAAHRRFADNGVEVTYLVDYPVIADPSAVNHLREALAHGRAAIGTQLHPWVNPPFDPATATQSFPGNLPPAVEAAKLAALTQAIAAAFDSRPLVYRAGRYGIGPATAALLVAHGYRLDSSMRARYDYRAEGGPDFRHVGPHAFWWSELIELPLTTVFTGHARRWGAALDRGAASLPRARGVLARTGLLSRVALTPEDMPLREALEAIRVAVGEGVRVLNFAFHSPSLVPGHTPYVRDAADRRAFDRWWDAVLVLLDRLGVTAVSSAELIAAADGVRPLAETGGAA